MKPLIAALLLALVAAPAMAGDVVDTSFVKAEGAHAFNVRDLVMMDRVSDPQLSPDGRYAAFGVRSTDYAANKGVSAIYVLDLGKGGQPVKVVDKGSSARWSADGRSLYFVAPAKGVAQLWRVDLGGKGGRILDLAKHAAPAQVSHSVLDLGGYKLSPDGKQVLLSYEVFTDCATLACTQQRVDARAKDKASGTLYDKLFVRHWDTWADGRRNQLFVARFDGKGQLAGEPKLLSRGIDGDVPSKPFGDESEFALRAGRQDRVLRCAHRRHQRAVVDQLRRVQRAGGRLGRAEEPHRRQQGVGRVPGGLAGRQDAVLPGDEDARASRPTASRIMALDLASGAKREVDP